MSLRAKENLCALGRGDQAPGGEGLFGSRNGCGHILSVRGGKGADDIGVVGGVEVQHGFAARSGEPLAADEILVVGIGHESLLKRGSSGW